jgi:hypothetical protein
MLSPVSSSAIARLAPQQPHQPRRAAPPRRQPHAHLHKAQLGLGCGQPQVAGGDDLAAPTYGVAVDGGDDWDRQPGHTRQRVAHHPVEPLAGFDAHLAAQLAQIPAGNERRPRPGDNQHAQVAVVLGGGNRRRERFLRLPVQGVARLRPVGAQHPYSISFFVHNWRWHGRSVARAKPVDRHC